MSASPDPNSSLLTPSTPLPQEERGSRSATSPFSRAQEECAGPTRSSGHPVGQGQGRKAVPPAVLALAILMLAALPYAAGYRAAPRGLIFLGALNNLGDTGQYLAALRQGAEGHLLYVNQYTSLRVAPALMYPLYTATGLLLAPLHLPAPAAYQLLHLLAAVALLVALWRFCSTVAPDRAMSTYTVAAFAGGLYLPVLLLSGLVQLPLAPVTLTAPELSLFATLLISPHGALGLAAELWALAGYVRWRRDGRTPHLIALSLGGLALGFSYPFGLPVLLAVVVVDAVGHRVWPAAPGLRVQRMRSDALLALSLLPAGAVALYYAVLFRHDPLWGASNMLHLPPPSLAVLIAAFGPLLVLGLLPLTPLPTGVGAPPLPQGARGGTTSSRARAQGESAGPAARQSRGTSPHGQGVRASPLSRLQGECAIAACGSGAPVRRGREVRAPCDPASRLVGTWAIVNGLLLLAPLPQSERLLSGWSVPLAIMAAGTLAAMRAPAARRWTLALSLSNVTLALLYLTVAATGSNRAYYEPVDEAAAVAWLATHAGPDDVVMASAGSGNLIVSAARCRVVVGQNFETFDWVHAQRDVLRYYARGTSAAERTAILRNDRVTLVLDGPYERALGGFTPPVGHGYRLLHTSGAVRVFAVEGG